MPAAPETQLDHGHRQHFTASPTSTFSGSNRYQTQAIGPGQQPDYINAVAQLNTQLSPLDLLDCLQQIEQQQGRCAPFAGEPEP